jgi:hypothetical protein
MRRLPQTSGYSYQRVASIRIDVHPAGENPTNTTRTLLTPVHVRPTHVSCGRSLYVATFYEAPIDLDRSHCSWEKGSWHNPQHAGWPIHGSAPNFSPEPANETGGCKPSSWWWPTTRFTEPISPACDRYVQYLLMGANRTFLNRHRRGLQPWRCRLAIYPLPDLPNQLSPFSPSGLARSPI